MMLSLSLADAQRLISAHGFDAAYSNVAKITEVVNDAFRCEPFVVRMFF